MVVKRTCSFCAGEIEPGTGTMFVKRDGAVFHFCSSSCRKQQLHLGRVGHRLKWTRAHALRRQQEQSSAASKPSAAASAAKPKPAAKTPKAETPGPSAPPAPEKSEAPSRASEPETAPEPKSGTKDETPAAAPAKKPRAKKPKEPAASA